MFTERSLLFTDEPSIVYKVLFLPIVDNDARLKELSLNYIQEPLQK